MLSPLPQPQPRQKIGTQTKINSGAPEQESQKPGHIWWYSVILEDAVA